MDTDTEMNLDIVLPEVETMIENCNLSKKKKN